jgi:hypothetical protein
MLQISHQPAPLDPSETEGHRGFTSGSCLKWPGLESLPDT